MTQQLEQYRRSGITLLELVGVLAIGSLILAISTNVIVNMLRMENQTREQVVQIESVSRLTDQFRQDIRNAREVRLSDPVANRLLVDNGTEQQIEYTLEGRSMVRTEKRGDERVSREGFRLSGDTRVTWEQVENNGRTYLRMRFSPERRFAMVVVAELGRNPIGAVTDGEAEL